MIPTIDEWDTSHFPTERRRHLSGAIAFEQIAAAIAQECREVKHRVVPYRTPPRDVHEIPRQIVFVMRTSPQLFDLFYNGRDGLRSRHWQSPETGIEATRYFIDVVEPMLLGSLSSDEAFARRSLRCPSAKVWVQERFENQLLVTREGIHLSIGRWITNEPSAPNGGDWRWCPADGALEVKGALIETDGTEHVPEAKLDRAQQIHTFGFT